MESKIYDFNQICDKVKQLNSEIRFVGVINQRGRLIAGSIKEGIKPLSSEKEDEMLFMELALRVKMRNELINNYEELTLLWLQEEDQWK